MLSLARKDSENNKVLGRFCLKLPLMPKLIWSCLKRPQKAFATECFRATRNFSTVLTVSGLKTKVIYSFSDKRFDRSMQNTSLRSSPRGPVPPDVVCSSLCGALLQSDALFVCSHAVPCASRQAQDAFPSRFHCSRFVHVPRAGGVWGVCVPLPQSRWRCSWLATQVALAALSWFALKQRGSIHLFCIALGCEPQIGSCVLLL